MQVSDYPAAASSLASSEVAAALEVLDERALEAALIDSVKDFGAVGRNVDRLQAQAARQMKKLIESSKRLLEERGGGKPR